MGDPRLRRAGHRRAPRERSQTLNPIAGNGTLVVREDAMSPAKGPHRRHRHGVCPTCNSEVRSEDRRESVVVCPECDTHVPIADGAE